MGELRGTAWLTGALGQAGLAARLAAEQDRWRYWLPVAVGIGVAAYFGAPAEPPGWVALVVAGPGLVLLAAGRRSAAARAVAIGLLLAGGGFALAQWHAERVAAPKLTSPLFARTVEGRVIETWALPRGQRLLLGDLSIAGLEPAATPKHVRVTTRHHDVALVGDRVRLRATLRPPSRPALPGSYDFERRAYFQQIGAYGFSLGAPDVLTGASEARAALRLWLNRLRQQVGGRVRAAMPPGTGAVAQALMTGDRGGIAEDDLAVMRDSGLAHLLAISGLHVGLMAATLFFCLRASLALWPALALRYPIKKYAAVGAMAGALAYLALTGATVPTQRAFVMVCVVMLAVILDRRVLSMALAAWAALAILATSPDSLLGASFQLSFAAVAALIAAYEVLREPLRRWRSMAGAAERALIYVAGVGLTTIVAGAATAPFAIYHFNRFALYGLAANLAAVPVMALWIMPWALLAYLLMTFGLERLALEPMGWGIGVVLAVAHEVASWPGSVALLPSYPPWGFGLLVFGGLWLCLWRRPWRLLGVALIAAGLVSTLFERGPDILVDGDGRLYAEGRLRLSSRRTARFVGEQWLRRDAQRADLQWQEMPRDGDFALRCDRLGCIYRARGHTAALVRDPRALADDCVAASIVVSLVPVRVPCPSARVVIDRFDLWRRGGHALWLAPDGAIRVEDVATSRGVRPWTTVRERRRRRGGAPSNASGSGASGRRAAPGP